MGIDGHRLKNSYNLSYDENKNHHRVIRPLISKYLAIFKLNRVWYQEDSVFLILTEKMKMMPVAHVAQLHMGIDGVAPQGLNVFSC